MSTTPDIDVDTDKETKHVVADTLAEHTNTVAKVEKTVGDETITRYYLRVGDSYAEVLPNNPRATALQRFTLCKRVEQLDETDDITITFQQSLSRTEQRHIADRVSPLRERLPTAGITDDADELSGGPPTHDYDDRVRDKEPPGGEPGTHGPIGTDDVYGTGW